MFWRRKKSSDFISLGLNDYTPSAEPLAEPVVESVAEAAALPPVASIPVIAGLEDEVGEPTIRVEPTIVAPVLVKPVAVVPVVPHVEIVPTAPLATPAPNEIEEEERGFFQRFRKAVSATRENLTTRLEDVVKGKKEIDAATLDELEEALIGADIGIQTTLEILDDVRQKVARHALSDADELKRVIKQHLLDILERAAKSRGVAAETAVPDDVRPYVLMVVGVNGVGKTTTIGKLAQRIKAEGNDVLICAADTFRAAASDQLAIWADRAGVPLIQQKQGTDPAAVLFDSLKAAKARNADVLIVDTAGRLHNKSNLMAELEKMKRVAGKEVKGAPHETLLVVDAVTGQNGLSQAREFLKAAQVTGLVLTKLDGTAKGGIAVAIAKELSLPIRYCGIGEQADDLVVFDARAYVDGLFE
ncbi:MAG: signal recognition particle-docking protein FtsY [Acidobacteria bacterium]|nr:signal recognition particle-docking protein FtsY [Acidobacteriota bacterium]MBI3424189.1 signal recognition particle-docking protein FtsY [Acidobacteriota bacterium]